MSALKFIRKVSVNAVAGANIVAIVLMLLVGYASHLSPTDYPLLSTLTLGFPLIALVNLLFLPLWILVKPKMVLLPLAGFLAAYEPVRNYFPINIPKDPPEGSIKVMSYNVFFYSDVIDKKLPTMRYGAVEYIKQSQPDIVAIQEGAYDHHLKNFVLDILPYGDSLRYHQDLLTIASKWPVIRKEPIPYESQGNASAAFWLDRGGDTIIVVNNHLESAGLTQEERSEFQEMMKGEQTRDTMRDESKRIFAKLKEKTQIRGPQADSVAAYVERHIDRYPIILCGDFNDSPNSYTHQRFSKLLTDCYVATGNGPGWSFHKHRMLVRIDNIFCSSHFTPYACKVDNKIMSSDHFPVICWLKMNTK